VEGLGPGTSPTAPGGPEWNLAGSGRAPEGRSARIAFLSGGFLELNPGLGLGLSRNWLGYGLAFLLSIFFKLNGFCLTSG
jgi:hypothetical protein